MYKFLKHTYIYIYVYDANIKFKQTLLVSYFYHVKYISKLLEIISY